MALLDRLETLRFGDLATFLAVRRHASISAAARALRVTPSQVSKAIARLEWHFGASLLTRAPRGVTLSESGERLLPRLQEVVERLQGIEPAAETVPEISVAAPSYLSSVFVPVIATSLPGVRVRGVELPPALIRAYASEGTFDLALTIGLQRLPKTWSSVRVGEVRTALYASPAVGKSFGRGPVDPARLTEHAFVRPVNSFNGQVVRIDDGCPLGAERKQGHEAQTIAIGLALAARTGQLVFGPAIAARASVDQGTVVEVPVRGWDVSEPLFVSCNGDRVLARVQRAVVDGASRELERLNRPARSR